MQMKIDVGELLKDVGNEADVEKEAKLACTADGIDIEGPVKVVLHLVNTGEGILATGSARAKVNLECSRCGKPFVAALNAKIEEQYSREVTDEMIFPIGSDNFIDLSEAIRQNLIISLPIKTICSKDCRLPEGISKNKKEPDPRLAKLKEVFKKEENKDASPKKATQ